MATLHCPILICTHCTLHPLYPAVFANGEEGAYLVGFMRRIDRAIDELLNTMIYKHIAKEYNTFQTLWMRIRDYPNMLSSVKIKYATEKKQTLLCMIYLYRPYLDQKLNVATLVLVLDYEFVTIVTDWRFGKIQHFFCGFFPKPSLQHFLVNVRIHYYFNDHGIGFHISIPKCLLLPPRHLFCDSQGDHSHELQDNRPPAFCILFPCLLPPCTETLPRGDWRWRGDPSTRAPPHMQRRQSYSTSPSCSSSKISDWKAEG